MDVSNHSLVHAVPVNELFITCPVLVDSLHLSMKTVINARVVVDATRQLVHVDSDNNG